MTTSPRMLFCFLSLYAAHLCALVPQATAQTSPRVPSSAIVATADSEFFPPVTSAFLTIDDSGMNGDLHDDHPQGHTMWLSMENGTGSATNNPAGLDGPVWLLYSFNELYELEEMWVWNHNQQNLTDRGLRNVSIHTSRDGNVWTKLGDLELTRAPGTPDYAHTDEIAFGGIETGFVLITASTTGGNYGSAYYGLSELRFYGDATGLPIPEPVCFPPDLDLRLSSIGVDPDYADMLLPQPVGWLGSDVGHSIVLSEDKTLWLFADTLIGRIENDARAGEAFINSSIGIQDRNATPSQAVEFFWGPGNTSFFPHQPGTPGDYYWPTSGWVIGGELFVFCYSVVPGGGAFGFALGNTTLIRVPNPLDPPDEWVQNAFDFGIDNDTMGFHSALYERDGHLYMMGYGPGQRMVLGRAQTSALAAGGLSDVMEFWVDGPSGPEWGDYPTSLTTLFAPSNTETNLQYIPEWGLYFTNTYNVFTGEISITWAPDLTGPWVDPVCFYQVPQFDEVSFDIIAYAARLHPELSTQPGELVLTYATNSFGSIGPLFTQEGLGIYHPRFVRANMERVVQSGVGPMIWQPYR